MQKCGVQGDLLHLNYKCPLYVHVWRLCNFWDSRSISSYYVCVKIIKCICQHYDQAKPMNNCHLYLYQPKASHMDQGLDWEILFSAEQIKIYSYNMIKFIQIQIYSYNMVIFMQIQIYSYNMIFFIQIQMYSYKRFLCLNHIIVGNSNV